MSRLLLATFFIALLGASSLDDKVFYIVDIVDTSTNAAHFWKNFTFTAIVKVEGKTYQHDRYGLGRDDVLVPRGKVPSHQALKARGSNEFGRYVCEMQYDGDRPQRITFYINHFIDCKKQ